MHVSWLGAVLYNAELRVLLRLLLRKHHEERLPDAVAVVHPAVEEAPIRKAGGAEEQELDISGPGALAAALDSRNLEVWSNTLNSRA